MLKLKIKPQEFFNDEKQEFYTFPEKETELQLEHSLVSISKWESKWHKPFLSSKNNNEKTVDELIDYVKCMTLNSNVDPQIYKVLTQENWNAIDAYIRNPMTATTFREDNKKKSRNEIITSEIIYYWMITFNIPFECQKWHLERLLTLIRVCSEKNAPPKKQSASEIAARNRALNKARRAKLHSKG